MINLRDIIKKLAQECLDNKWLKIREAEKKEYRVHGYNDDCAFCDVANIQYMHDFDNNHHTEPCDYCLCPDEICYMVNIAHEIGDSSLIIKGLEQLIENGKITKELIKELDDA